MPKQLRCVDKTTLTWDQLRLVLLSVPLRGRVLLTLDMTETFCPSELFALRWNGFAMESHTLTVSQTAYRGKLRDYGKSRKSLRTVQLPEGLAASLIQSRLTMALRSLFSRTGFRSRRCQAQARFPPMKLLRIRRSYASRRAFPHSCCQW